MPCELLGCGSPCEQVAPVLRFLPTQSCCHAGTKLGKATKPPARLMKQFLKVTALATCLLPLGACGGSDDELQLERKISVACYESITPKNDASYSPKEWNFTSTMLFNCQPIDIDKAASTASLANGIATLTDGQTIKAQYQSSTGVINNAAYGSYTLVVFCTGNPFNSYLESRWTCQQFNYTEGNSVAALSCCFIWEDMAIGGGWSAWVNR